MTGEHAATAGFRLDGAVLRDFPGVQVRLVTARGLRTGVPWDRLERECADARPSAYGVFDLGLLDGPVVFGPAVEGDVFVPYGRPAEVERPAPGALVHAVAGGRVLTRPRGCAHRFDGPARVTERTVDAVFLLEHLDRARPDGRLAATRQHLAGLLAPYAREVVTSVVEAETPLTLLRPDEPGLCITGGAATAR